MSNLFHIVELWSHARVKMSHSQGSVQVHHSRGFTLVETLVYLALFGFLMSGVVLTAYQLFESSGRSSTRAMLEEEGDFLTAKIVWALSGIQAVVAPATPVLGGECTQNDILSVSKWDASIGAVVIALSGDNLTLAKGGGPAMALNNSNVRVSSLQFTHCYPGGVNPESVEVRFTLTTYTPSGQVMSKEFFTSDHLHR